MLLVVFPSVNISPPSRAANMPSFYYLMGVREDDFGIARRYLTSWLIPPIGLALVRAFVSLYCFATLFFILVWQGTHGSEVENRRELCDFTNLSFWGIAIYNLVAAVHTLVYARAGKASLEHWPRPLRALHSLFYSTIVTFPHLVTIVFWIFIYRGVLPDSFTRFVNVSFHLHSTLS